ncbi:MAG: tetratricopeptide repeat protein [Pseudomonadota bacterium]|nr:tetratricopeptide repeat protein [Pseudomonadota bacterium]
MDTKRFRNIAAGLAIVMAAGTLVACGSSPTRSEAPKTASELAAQRAAVTAALAKGAAAERSGDDDRAMLEYASALQIDPRSADIRVRIGGIYARSGDVAAARTAYTDALTANPNHADAHEGAGLILLRQQHYDAARVHLQRAISLNAAGRWRSHNGLGMMADLTGDTKGALTHYAVAVSQQMGNAALRNNMGYSRYLAGQYRMAETDYLAALKLDRNYALAWSNLALVRVRMGNAAGGVEAFAEAMKLPQAYNNVGYLLYLQGSLDEAERYLQRAVAQSPSYYEIAQQNLERVQVSLRDGRDSRDP